MWVLIKLACPSHTTAWHSQSSNCPVCTDAGQRTSAPLLSACPHLRPIFEKKTQTSSWLVPPASSPQVPATQQLLHQQPVHPLTLLLPRLLMLHPSLMLPPPMLHLPLLQALPRPKRLLPQACPCQLHSLLQQLQQVRSPHPSACMSCACACTAAAPPTCSAAPASNSAPAAQPKQKCC